MHYVVDTVLAEHPTLLPKDFLETLTKLLAVELVT